MYKPAHSVPVPTAEQVWPGRHSELFVQRTRDSRGQVVSAWQPAGALQQTGVDPLHVVRLHRRSTTGFWQ